MRQLRFDNAFLRDLPGEWRQSGNAAGQNRIGLEYIQAITL